MVMCRSSGLGRRSGLAENLDGLVELQIVLATKLLRPFRLIVFIGIIRFTDGRLDYAGGDTVLLMALPSEP